MTEINPFEVLDYREEVREKTTSQFYDGVVFNKLLDIIHNETQDVQEVYRGLMQERSLDTAYGEQLDVLGRIVGQPRTLIDADLFEFFGFRFNYQAGSYGSITFPDVGAVWWDGNAKMTGNITLEDSLYRLLIKAKIAKNTTRATPEDVMRLTNFIFGTQGSNIIDEGGAAYTLLLGKILSKQEIGLLKYVDNTLPYRSKLLPKPIGVGVNYGMFDYEGFFSFQGIQNAKGYGALSYSNRFDGSALYDGSVSPKLSPLINVNGNPYDPNPVLICKRDRIFAFHGVEGASSYGSVGMEVQQSGYWNNIYGITEVRNVCHLETEEQEIIEGDGLPFGGKWASYLTGI